MKKVYFVKGIISLAFTFILSIGLNAQTTWYAINSGDWDNPNNWTLDPAAAVHYNPSNSFPQLATDNVVIKTGITITVPLKDPALVLNCGTITVDGRLDLGTTTGHAFAAIRGSGRILMKADNFPAGNATHFVTKGQGEGTVVFQGNSFAITNSRTFYNMEVQMNAGQSLALGANVNLNGNLNVNTGALNIGNSTTPRTLVVNGNVTVDNGASFGVGTANAIHSLELFGNFTNNGTVQFSNSAQYAAANNGAVKVLFRGASNNSLVANGTTNFYRMIVNKGVDQSFVLTFSANDVNNFKLFGPVTGTDGLDASDGTLGWEQLPIVLRNGTLKLGSNIVIPQLGYNRGNNNPKEFTISATTRLWIDGANVTSCVMPGSYIDDWTGITVFGTLQISQGALTTPALSSGISYYSNAATPANFVIEGGNIFTTQLRQKDTNGRLNYTQTGGTVHFNNSATNNWSSPVFSLPNPSQVFEMKGGNLIFNVANNNSVTGIYINSVDGNHHVSGGTVEIRIPSSRDFKIYSQAPFYNLSTVSTGSTQKVWMTNLYGDNNAYFDGNLVVLNDLTVAAGTTFDPGSYNLFLGRNLTINGTFATGGKITLNGSANGTVTNNSATFTINKLFVEKEQPSALINLAGTGNFAISDSLTLASGNFDLGNKQVPAQGHISLLNGSILNSGSGRLVLSGNTSRNLFSARGKDLSFGVIELNKTSSAPHITLTSAAKAREVIFTGNQVMNLDIHNLEIEVAGTYKDQTWSANRMFRTAGNASDGGLTLPVVLNGNYGASNNATGTVVQVFPIGIGTGYHPMTLYARNTLNKSGEIRVVPVNNQHPTVDDSKKNDAIPFYWRIWNNVDVTPNDLRYHFLFGSNIASNLQKDRVLTNYVWSEPGASFPGNNSINFYFGAPLEQDYTCGNQSAFNSITRLYSKTSGNWNNATTWTTNADHATGTGSVPKSYDVVIIGGVGATNHNVTISANNAVASQVYIKGKSETNIGIGNDGVAPPTLTIAHNTSGHNIDLIKGHGRIVHQNNNTNWSDYPRINGDYSEFCLSNEAILEFTGTGEGPRIMPANSIIPVYPNLHITGTAGTSQFAWGNDLKVKGNLVVTSTTLNLPPKDNGMVSIDGNVVIHNGTIGFPVAYNHHMTINGDLIFTSNGTFNGQSGSADKNLFLKGNLSLGSGNIQFNSTQKINLVFTGISSATYSKGSGTANFFRVTIDKSEGQKVHFTAPFNLGAATDGATKAFVLKSGMAHLDNSGIDINLSTGGADFRIPSSAILNVDNGAKVNIGGASNTGLWLDGSLILNNGARANFDRGTGSALDNYIQYTASGNASIWIGNGAQLHVGSQIRRQTTTTAGTLKFTQANANTTVQIAKNSAPVNARGVFEILNESSSFVQTETGSSISILRGQPSPAIAALYFDPASASIATGSGFAIGGGVNGQTIRIYAGKPLQDLTINSVNAPVAQLDVLPLTLNGNLTINTGATFNANGLDVNIKGNMVNAGTYNAAGNTTYFSGNANQAITGATTFHNLVKNGGTARLTLNSATPVTVSNNLTLTSGSFDTGINSVIVRGNTRIDDGFFTLSSGSSEGFILQGATQQRLTGSGTFARLTVDNINGVVVPTQSSSVNYSDQLRLKQGVLDIGRNLMILQKNASIVAVNPFSSNNMIQTNLSFTDAGIMKYIPAGAQTVVYPIGSGGKYTPVTLNVTANTADNGFVRVKAANEPHITILEANRNNVLNYNWTLDAGGVSDFSGNAVMQAIPADARVTAPNTLNNYIAARILAGSIDWNKLENIYQGPDLIEGFNKDTYQLVFRFNNTNASLINGDYTAGVANAIPDQVPSYITVNNGNWTSVSTWATYNPITNATGATGVNIPAGGPRGSIVIVNHNLTISDNFMSAYRTRINASGVVNIGNTINHRFGTVSGQGRLVLQNGSFPAGTYDDFFAPTGGTVEFAGSNDYDILSELPMVNNVVFSGSGTRRMSNLETIVFNGNMELSGPVLVNEFSKINAVKGNIVFNSGSYVAKEGSIAMAGTNLQTIGGSASFTETSGLYNLIINNGVGVTLQNNVEVKNELTFTKGVINSSDASILTITNTNTNAIIGATATSYVNGPLRKNINAGNAFIYPIGKGGRYGQLIVNNVSTGGLWMVEYFNNGASDRGTFDGTVKYVSSNEFWNVTAPSAGAQAIVTLRWDANSGVNPDDDAFRVVSSTGTGWSAVGYTNKTGNMSGGTVNTISLAYNNSRRFTFGSNSIAPYTWTGSSSSDWFTPTNWSGNVVPSASNNATIAIGTNSPIIQGAFIAQTNNLTINNGVALTLKPGGKLTVNGNLEINQTNGLILENNTEINGLASVITKGNITGTGNSNVKLTLTKDRWYYITSAVNNAVLGNFSTGNPDAAVHVYRNNQWYSTGIANVNTPLLKLEGVLVKYATNPTFTINYSGTLNNGAVERTFTAGGWYLFGNPYPSFINWQNDAGWNRPNIDGTMWYRTRIGETMTFITYNRLAPAGARVAVYPSGTFGNETEMANIPPNQALWIKAYAATTLSINNDGRTHGVATSQLKSGNVKSEADVIRIVAANSQSKDGAVIYFDDSATNGFDVRDSEKRFNDSKLVPEVYTRISNTSLAINGLKPLENNDISIPLSVRNGNLDDVTLTFDLSMFNAMHTVTLEDLKTGEVTNLRGTESYTYKPLATGDVHDRFEIHLKYVVTSVVNPEDKQNQVDDNDISISGVKGKAVVKISSYLLDMDDAQIEVYTLTGQRVSSTTSAASLTLVNLPNTEAVYVIKVMAGGKTKTEKVVGKAN